MYLPLAVALAVVAFFGEPLTTWFGYYNPVLIIGGTFAVVGAGLLVTLELDTSIGKWISYQIIYGVGIGLAFQPPCMAVQTVLAESMVPMALVMLNFAQQLGGIVVLAIAQNVFFDRTLAQAGSGAWVEHGRSEHWRRTRYHPVGPRTSSKSGLISI